MTGLPAVGRFPGLPTERMTPEQTELAAAFTGRRGAIPGPYRIWLSNAPFAARMKGLSDHLLRGGALTTRESEIAILVTARARKAPYVEAAHRRLAAAAGLAPAVIDPICDGEPPPLEDARERAVYEAACAMHTDRPADRAVFDRAVAALGHEGVSELAGLLGFYCACAFTLSFYAVEPPTAPVDKGPRAF